MIHELELQEHDPNSTVHVMVGWYDDGDCFYVERCDPGDTESEPHQQEGDVPADLWARHIAGHNLFMSTIDEMVALVDVTEGGTTKKACPEWQGTSHHIDETWYLVLGESGDENTWPLRDVQIGWSYSTWAEAEAALDAMPTEFYLAAGGGAPGPQLTSRDRVSIRKSLGRDLVSDCERCGHSRDAHGGDQ